MSNHPTNSGFFRLSIRPWGVVTAAGAVSTIATFLGFIGSLHWLLDMFSHFRVQYFVALAASALLLLIPRHYKTAACFTPYYDANALEQLFHHKLLKMLLEEGAISQWHIYLLMSWQHSGFNVHVCEPIAADDRNALEILAHYIIRCQFSQERMTYLEQNGSVIYCSKDGHTTKNFSALDWNTCEAR
jgi:hypothetical protein